MNEPRVERLLKLRRAAAVLEIVCALWIVGGLAYIYIAYGARTVASATWWGTLLSLGPLLGLFGLAIGLRVRSNLKERLHWARSRRGTAIVSALRPGETVPLSGKQLLTCGVELRVSGVPDTRADYIGAVGPLDTPRFLEGAVLACEVNPAKPERVRIWPHADPKGGELTGSCLEFMPL